MIPPMRQTRDKARGLGQWLGLFGRRVPLTDDVAVISPHLDDGVFSLGAAVSHAARKGARVRIVTVLAGDPASTIPAGEWDGTAGFRTAGEAARARREEDSQACALIGAEPVWLAYSDQQYSRGADDAEIRTAVVDAVGSAIVVLPGFPLMNADHRWLRRVLDGAFPPERVGVYVEQPYAALWSSAPGDGPSPEPARALPPEAWGRVEAGLRDQGRKLRACRAYRSQVPLLGPVFGTMFKYEMRVGGESAAWPAGRA
jgi:LmbE family N-acetylglucosaminyl deacetylase